MPTPNDALRVIRKQRELSARQLAAQAGVSTATISRIESGKRAGSLETLARIAAALDVDPELIGGLSERVAS